MKARVIAFYLPQYHPIPENDKWWGKGFTEWINVAKARPLFKGHYEPHLPADLGFYDLRLHKTRIEQAEMAKQYGIEGFCYWEYWFGGKERQLLEKPFEEVLEYGTPDFPFCLGWANESWKNSSWHAQSSFQKSSLLIEQKYSVEDYKEHFYQKLPAFKDKRYITVDGKPLYVIFNPYNIPNPKEFIKVWRQLANENGLGDFYFVGITGNMLFKSSAGKGNYQIPNLYQAGEIYSNILDMGFDAVNSRGYLRAETILDGRFKKVFDKILEKLFHYDTLKKYDHSAINKVMYVEEDKWENVYPTIIPNWDRSPRSGKKASIYYNSTPEVFEKNVADALELLKERDDEHKIIFAKSWNEWGEGNHLEPDLKYGLSYLEVLAKLIK